MREHNYYVYILTNKNKTVLYVGMTNHLQTRLIQHKKGVITGFTQKYNCHYLVHLEHFTEVSAAIDREKQLKKWSRRKKMDAIEKTNSHWQFLDEEVLKNNARL